MQEMMMLIDIETRDEEETLSLMEISLNTLNGLLGPMVMKL